MKLDFHVHTEASPDSLIRPRDLAKKSLALGIVPAVADHDSIGSHGRMRAAGAPFIPAEEVFTDKGDLVGLYVSELVPKNTPFLEAIDIIHAQGGLAYLPHMFDWGRAGKHASAEEASRADIIEVFNARCLREEYNVKAAAFAKARGLPGAAGSDSHFLFEFGRTYTELPDFDIESPKALMKALESKAARIEAHSAPFFVRGTTTIVMVARKLSRSLRR